MSINLTSLRLGFGSDVRKSLSATAAISATDLGGTPYMPEKECILHDFAYDV